MLTITERRHGMDRRGFLTIGSLALGGLSLSSLLSRSRAADAASHLSGKSVIFLFQQGGPSQFETYDPKPDAPEGTRTVGGTIQTALPGVHFGESLPQLAKLADKLTIVRSYQTNNAGHNLEPLVSSHTLNANMGSLYSRVAGATRAGSGMPTNTVLFPQAVCPDVTKGAGRGDIASTGNLGTIYAPFVAGGGGQVQANMRLNLDRDRFEDRRALLGSLNELDRSIDTTEQVRSVNELQDQAVEVLLSGGVADALDLSKENPKVLASYDTSKYLKADGWSKVARGKKGYYTGSAKSVGKLLCLGRRLCEAGCGFVTIHADYEGVWDMHADGNNLNIEDGMQAIGRPFDHAVAAFIQDVEARGLSDKILLVCCGEMGRTPKINKNGGRDHWAKLSPLLLYGGGIKGGQVIGQSTRDGGQPATEPFNPKHLVSTILHTVCDVGQLRLLPSMGAVSKLAEHEPITGVF